MKPHMDSTKYPSPTLSLLGPTRTKYIILFPNIHSWGVTYQFCSRKEGLMVKEAYLLSLLIKGGSKGGIPIEEAGLSVIGTLGGTMGTTLESPLGRPGAARADGG